MRNQILLKLSLIFILGSALSGGLAVVLQMNENRIALGILIGTIGSSIAFYIIERYISKS